MRRWLIVLLLTLSACTQTFIQPTEVAMTLSITSPAFKNGSPIPAVYTCISKDVSPALAWSGPPSATKSFALIMDDPDAPGGTWVHWVIYNIPASRAWTSRGRAHQSSTRRWQFERRQQLGQFGLRRSMSAQRNASLLLQALCAGYDARSSLRSE